MRKRFIPFVVAALCLAGHDSAQAQDPAQNAAQSAPKSATQSAMPQQPQQQAISADSSDPPMSLADMARAARAKKQADTKPVAKISKLLDDDNMPRGVYAADIAPAKPVAGTEGQASPASGAPFPEFRGKVILLDFWASWCGPCRRSLPSLKRLRAVYGSADLVVISISEDDDEAAWRSFVSSNQMNWPQRLDSDGSLQTQFGVNALPTYVLIGRDGTVLQKFVGEAPAESIVERIGPDLKASLAAKP
jgi:cytochrome c biogenesis protein CcmG/thiol:disulfide interchange protein DsbE